MTGIMKCRTCKTQIMWAVDSVTGRRMPLDRLPDGGPVTRTGRVDADGRPIVRLHANAEVAFAATGETRRWSVHACPKQGEQDG